MVETEIKPVNKLGFGIDELWQYRELFYYYTWRDIKVRYKQTFFGFAWAVIQPILMMVLFSFFFGKKLGVPSDSIPYPVFVFTGLLFWNIFSTGLTSASNSILNNAHIMKKIYFPRLIIPISSVMVTLFDFLMAFSIYLVILFYYHLNFNVLEFIGCLIGALCITSLATFGLGTFLAALNIKYRDFKYVIPYTIQVLLFLSPVIYPSSIVTNIWAKYFMAINPLSGAIALLRSAVANSAIDWSLVSISICSAIVLFFVGILYFKKSETYFADVA
jgi:lipopolysaccharide transport system permease protein